jgi:uncharacterized protein (TIGR02246 family)
MDAIDRVAIERECERLVTRYCHIIDHGEASRVAELFSEDGTWRGPGVVMQGIEQIRVGFAAREANRARMSRHVCNNLLIDVVDEDNATGVVYLTLYRHDGDEKRRVSPLEGVELVGEYRDRFVRTPDGWRIADRSTHVSFVRENVAKEAG